MWNLQRRSILEISLTTDMICGCFFLVLSCLVPEVQHATHDMSPANGPTPGVILANVTVAYVCEDGYAFPNNSANYSVGSITCLGSNRWNHPVPKCEGKSMDWYSVTHKICTWFCRAFLCYGYVIVVWWIHVMHVALPVQRGRGSKHEWALKFKSS